MSHRACYTQYPGEYAHVPDHVFATPLTKREAAKIYRQYGAGEGDLIRESRHATGQRMFYMHKLVPFRLSADELAKGDLRRIAVERKIRLSRLRRMRNQARCRHGCPTDSPSSTTPPGTSPSPVSEGGPVNDVTSSSRSSSSSTRTSCFTCDLAVSAANAQPSSAYPCLSLLANRAVEVGERHAPSLQLLAEVAAERSRGAARSGESPRDGDGIQRTLTAQLGRYPLPVLRQVSAVFTEAKAVLEEEYIAAREDEAVEAAATFLHERNNVLLFNVCLWQRRYPIEVVAMVLELYRTGQLSAYMEVCPCQDAAGQQTLPVGFALPPSPVVPMQDLMEALTAAAYPQLHTIPWLIRCDVLMSYPLMPVAEQLAMMVETSEYIKRERQRRSGAAAGGNANRGDGSAGEEGESSSPTPVRVLLHGYLPDNEIFERDAVGLTDAQYRALRRAFEHHKQDGVRRLCSRSYH